jgi:hypothetical protein
MAVHDDDRRGGVNHIGAGSTVNATRGAAKTASMSSDEAVTKFFELPHSGNNDGMAQQSPKKIARSWQKSQYRVDGGGAGSHGDDRPVFLAFYEYRGARTLIIMNTALLSQFLRALTRLKANSLGCPTLYGPIAPIAAETAIAIVEEPITHFFAPANHHGRV